MAILSIQCTTRNMKINDFVFRQTGTRYNSTCIRAHCRDLKFAKHTHEEINIGYAVKGGQRSYRKSGTVDLISDLASVMVVNHDEVHDGYQITEDGWQYEGLYIPLKCFTEYSAYNHGLDYIPYFYPAIIHNPCLLRMIQRIVKYGLSKKDHMDVLAIEVAESNLIDYLISHYSIGPRKSNFINKGKVYLAREAMYDNPLTEFNLGQLAAIASLNPSYFVRAFKAEYGISPYAYLVQLRVGIARKLLIDGIPISNIASICQFYDQSHFTKYFRKIFGITPGEYKKYFVKNN